MALPNAAIVGLGFMGRTHLQALRRLGVKICGVIGLTPEEGAKFASENQIERVYRDLDEVLADPQVGVVHICTPNYLHFPMSKAALNAGKNVICEKPLGISRQETGELAKLAKQKGLAAAVNYNLRFYPLVQDARARVQSGELGDVHLALGGYLQDWLYLASDWNWRLETEAGGTLRAVADIGTHWMDMVCWMTGLEIVEVMADLTTLHTTRYKPLKEVETFEGKMTESKDTQPVAIQTEDIAMVMMHFSNGARGSMTLSQVTAGRKNNCWWEISGSKATLHWEQEEPNAMWVGHRERPNELVVKDPSLMLPGSRQMAGYPGGHAEGYPDTFLQMFNTVYGPLSMGKPLDDKLTPTFAAGHRQELLCDAILRSSRERSWVSVEKE